MTPRRCLRFICPLPPRELSPNSRLHWARKAAAVAEYRRDVRIAAMASIGAWQAPGQATLHLTFCLANSKGIQGVVDRTLLYHPRDPDNAQSSFKAGLDGLRDAGVIRGDEWDRVTIAVAMTKDRGPFVEVVTSTESEASDG